MLVTSVGCAPSTQWSDDVFSWMDHHPSWVELIRIEHSSSFWGESQPCTGLRQVKVHSTSCCVYPDIEGFFGLKLVCFRKERPFCNVRGGAALERNGHFVVWEGVLVFTWHWILISLVMSVDGNDFVVVMQHMIFHHCYCTFLVMYCICTISLLSRATNTLAVQHVFFVTTSPSKWDHFLWILLCKTNCGLVSFLSFESMNCVISLLVLVGMKSRFLPACRALGILYQQQKQTHSASGIVLLLNNFPFLS